MKTLIEDIKHLLKSGDYLSYDIFPDNSRFLFTKLKTESKENGFMVFSRKDIYVKKDIENFEKYKFDKYPYKHRYYAYYDLGNNKKTNKNLIFIMYNPSYANPETRDVTVENCINLTKKNKNKYNGVEILNLFSLRNPNPKVSDLRRTNSYNEEFIIEYIRHTKSDVVFAWGNGKNNKNNCSKLIQQIKKEFANKNIFIIGINEEIANTIIHHPDQRVWNGIGGFDNVAKLVNINTNNLFRE